MGTSSFVKVWAHVIATVAGLLLAGLIVFIVFGNASKEGALQDGTAPTISADGTVCGSVKAADISTAAARTKALKNLPTAIGPSDQPVEFTRADQKAWLARVQAASGLCIDEIRVGLHGATATSSGDTTKISMSTVKRVSEPEASIYTGATLLAANQAPLNGRNVDIITYVGDQKREIYFSVRAYRLFLVAHKGLGLGTTAADLVKFRTHIGSGLSGTDIRINGWS
jgi:hypothetical protein